MGLKIAIYKKDILVLSSCQKLPRPRGFEYLPELHTDRGTIRISMTWLIFKENKPAHFVLHIKNITWVFLTIPAKR
jgi:hypothetical protein